MYYWYKFYSYEHLKETIEYFIKYYNEERIKEKSGYLTPWEYRKMNIALKFLPLEVESDKKIPE